jgi:membrane dipeptidase
VRARTAQAGAGEFGNYGFKLSDELERRSARCHADATIIDIVWWGPNGYRSFTSKMDAELRAAYQRHHDVSALMTHAHRMPGRLAVAGQFPEYREHWDASGITAGHSEIHVGDLRVLLEDISYVDYVVDHLPWLQKALRADDFRTAKRTGGHALYMQCQPSSPITADFSVIDLAYDAGLRVLQLSYNVQDAIGTGCTERSAGGVSNLGARLIRRLNNLGVIVDVAHCNAQTALDACRISEQPVIVSHTAAAARFAHDRGILDDVALAVAETGGIVGVVAAPPFLANGSASIETMLDHIDHFAQQVGWEHVSIGTDWPLCAPKWALVEFESWVLAHGFRPEHGIVPTMNLVGFDDYRDFPNITRGLVAHGYTDEQIKGILGENFLRVFQTVCG